jgi:hypothetical protein
MLEPENNPDASWFKVLYQDAGTANFVFVSNNDAWECFSLLLYCYFSI